MTISRNDLVLAHGHHSFVFFTFFLLRNHTSLQNDRAEPCKVMDMMQTAVCKVLAAGPPESSIQVKQRRKLYADLQNIRRK